MNQRQLQTALIFCIAFVAIGYLAPVVFASYAPAGYYVDDVELTAGDTTVDAEHHDVCLTYDARSDITGMVIREMVLIDDSGELQKVGHLSHETHFKAGSQAMSCGHTLPSDLEPGTYQYRLSFTFTVENGRIERTVTTTSNTFTVTEDGTVEEVPCTN